jgi:hypothetical protein
MKQSIKNLKQLIFLFNAGHGEFHFLNKDGRMFNLKFNKLHHDSTSQVSLVYTYFSKISERFVTLTTNKLQYNHIGRYNFQTKQLELRTDPVIPDAGVKIAVEALGYILEGVNTGRDITKEIQAYYSPRCCRCGKALTSPSSLLVGLGPECHEYYKSELPKAQLDLFNIS